MSKVLKVNVAIQENPPYGAIRTFLAGETLPAEFADVVGEHVYQDPKDTSVVSSKGPADLPSAPQKPVETEEVELNVPTARASAAVWKKFAKEAGVKVPATASRDEVIEHVLEAHPEIEIPE